MDTMTATPENQSPAADALPTDNLSPTPAKKSRGRPAGRARLTDTPAPKPRMQETPQQRIERLQAELQKAHEAKKLAEEHRDSIVGKVVVAHALANDKYRNQLAALLRSEIKNKSDLAVIAELLVEP